MASKLTAEEEAEMVEYLNNGSQRTAELLDLVRQWDSIPCEAPDPDHPQYAQRVMLLASYLNWSHTKTLAWDGMQKLLAELQRRKEPVPEILQIWAYAVAQGQLPRPGSRRGRRSEWERNGRIAGVLKMLRNRGYTWEEAINQVADWMCLAFDTVKVAVRNHKRERPYKVKKRPKDSPNTTG